MNTWLTNLWRSRPPVSPWWMYAWLRAWNGPRSQWAHFPWWRRWAHSLKCWWLLWQWAASPEGYDGDYMDVQWGVGSPEQEHAP